MNEVEGGALRRSVRWYGRLLIAGLSVALIACGGGGGGGGGGAAGGGDGGSTGTQTQYLSGTVAAGAPVIGVVEVKDVGGRRKQVQINADGSYRFGLNGLTFPLLLRAIGHVGGNRVVLTSAATVEDVDRTVNITPFTDLMIANVAGGDTASFFDNPDFSRVTVVYLDEARVMITQRIAPVMTELGVDPDFNLRLTAFAADHTRFDAVLDVIRVTVDQSTRRATIVDVVNGQQVEDDLADIRDRTPLPTPPAGSYSSAVSELIAIDAVLERLNTLFAGSLPSVGDTALGALFATDFLYGGLDLGGFLDDEGLLAGSNVGVQLINPVIVSRASDGSSMRVRVQVVDSQSRIISNGRIDSDELEFRKEGGAWRIAGDRQMGDVSLSPVNSVRYSGEVAVHARALELWVPSADEDVAYVQLTGAGLPASTTITGLGAVGGVVLKRAAGGGFGVLASDGTILGTAWVQECPATVAGAPCVDMSALAPNTVYTVRFLDAGFSPLGDVATLTLARPPVSIDEARSNFRRWFPTVGAAYPVNYPGLSDGAYVRVSWTRPTDTAYVMSDVGLVSGSTRLEARLEGSESSRVVGTWSGAAPASSPQVWLSVTGPYDRKFVVLSRYPG